MKKVSMIILAIIFSFSLVACGSNAGSTGNTDTTASASQHQR